MRGSGKSVADTQTQTDLLETLDLAFVFSTLRRRAGLILAGVGGCLVAAFLYLTLVPERYTAKALVLFEPTGQQLRPGEAVSNIPRSRIESEIEIARSEPVLFKVILDLDLLNRPDFLPKPSLLSQLIGGEVDQDDIDGLLLSVREGVQSALRVRQVGLSSVLEFSAETTSPDVSAELANEMAEAYLALQVETKIQSTLSALEIIEAATSVARENLEASQGALVNYLGENADEISLQTGNAEISLLAGQIRQERLALQSLGQSSQRLQDLITDENGFLQEGELASLQSQEVFSELQVQALQRLQIQRQRLIDRRAEGLSEEEVEETLAQIDARLSEIAANGINSISEVSSQSQQLISDLNSQLEVEVFSLDLPPAIAAELFSLQSSAQSAQRQYTNLLDQVELLGLQARTQVADSRLFAPASPPPSPSFPNTGFVLGGTFALAFLFFSCLVLFTEAYFGGFSTGSQLRDFLGVKNVVEVPKIKGEETVFELAYLEPFAPAVERMRMIRALLELGFAERGKTPGLGQVVACMSSLPAEGKTSASLGLAMVSAASGMRVCVVDLDFRRPKIAKLTGLASDDSLMKFLKSGEVWPKVRAYHLEGMEKPIEVFTTDYDDTAVADQLFFGIHFQAFISALQESYDLIILDTAPVLSVAASRFIQRVTDNIVFCVRANLTNKRLVRDTVSSLGLKDTGRADPVVVLSQTQTQDTGYATTYQSYAPQT